MLVSRVPERFGPGPAWARRVLWLLALVSYLCLLNLAMIAVTWPADGLTAFEVASGRVGGVVATIAAAVCLLSYPLKRWRWEMHGAWALGLSFTGVAAAVASVDLTASRGMLLTSLLIVIAATYTRAVSLVIFGLQTTDAAMHVKRLRRHLSDHERR